jgi:hypothetical protein
MALDANRTGHLSLLIAHVTTGGRRGVLIALLTMSPARSLRRFDRPRDHRWSPWRFDRLGDRR